jgi:hypothetical protein
MASIFSDAKCVENQMDICKKFMHATIIFSILLCGNKYCKCCMSILDFCLQSNIDYQIAFPSLYLHIWGMQMIIGASDFVASMINVFARYKREYNEKMQFYANCITITYCGRF